MMRQIFFASILLSASLSMLSQGASINWIKVDDLEAAQAKEPRKVLIDVYTQWCGPCKMMMRNTFTNADVISYINANYYAVKFDAEGPDPVEFKGKTYSFPNYTPGLPKQRGSHQLSQYFRVRAYPTLVYLDENLEMIAPISGYKSPAQLEPYVKFFNEAWYQGAGQADMDVFIKESFQAEW